MRPFGQTLPFDEALRLVIAAAVPLDEIERVGLVEADGRVAARPIAAAIDVPPFDRSAMDGYAVIAADTSGASRGTPVTLRCLGRVFAGEVADRPIRPGECLEIATGAPVPDGANAVVMVEDTGIDEGGQDVQVFAPVQPRQNVGPRGSDLAAGVSIVAVGDLLTPSRVGAIAAAGARDVEVFRRPSVAILSTGNELAEAGRPLRPGQIYEVNRYTLAAVVSRHGGEPVLLPSAKDTLDDLRRALEGAASHDVIVLSGGSSVGDRDLVLDVVPEQGDVTFHGIAVKPGKPTLFGRVGKATLFGMPGNPTSCLSNAYMLLVPFLRKTARLPPLEPRTIELPLARTVTSARGRHQFYTVRIVDGRAEPAFKASGDITSMAHADGYIEIPAPTDIVEAGTTVTVKLF